MILAIIFEILSILVCIPLFPFRQTFFDPKKQEEISDSTPVLLVHGYLHNSSGWIYHRKKLKKAGLKNIFMIDLGFPFLSIEEYAKRVAGKIEEIKKLTNRSDIILVGHSMGGLVSAYYALHMAEKQKINVTGIITLGSPLKGTKIAVLGLGKCANQMRFESEFVQVLQEDIKRSKLPFYHIFGSLDELVFPKNSAFIKENPHTEIKNIGHVSFLFSSRINDHMVEYLKKKG